MHNGLTIRRILVFATVVVMLLGSTRHGVSAQSATWQTLTTDHFEIYYERQLGDRVDGVAFEAERAYRRIAADLRYDLTARVPLILLSSVRELPANRAAATDIVLRSGAPNRDHLVLSAEPVEQREGTLTHELTHHFEFEMIPQSPRLPPWVYEGLSEYERHRWTPSGPSIVQASSLVPSVSRLTSSDRDWSRAVFDFIADEFGADGIRRYLSALKDETASNRDAIQEVFGFTSSRFDREFERYVKAREQLALRFRTRQ
jgi:hypothetical protein